MIIPNDARRELYGLQVICAGMDLSYIELIWSKRYSDLPKSAGSWPFLRAEHQDNVTQIRKRTTR